MGLSSSQVRLLTLTSRQHNIEYQAQKIQAEKLRLSNESDKVYAEYLERLDATKIQYKVVNNDGSYRFDDATFTLMTDSKAGFMFDVDGVICRSYAEVKEALADRKGISIQAEDSYTVLSTLISQGFVTVIQDSSDPESGYSVDGRNIVYTHPATGKQITYKEDGYIDYDGSTRSYPEDESYQTYFYKMYEKTSVSTSTKVQEVRDEVNVKKVEAIYEADMNKINAKDARYDNELSQLETERSAIKQEMDTLKNVSKENVERTFKIFS